MLGSKHLQDSLRKYGVLKVAEADDCVTRAIKEGVNYSDIGQFAHLK